ncbi:MAG: tyrosine--tRNA ligase [Acidimicrobiales bacterium]|nr:tyrosine--tRNA ligase [Acidimicrobiales bacterium]
MGGQPCPVSDKGSAVIDDLLARGLVQDSTDLDALRQRCDRGPITLYCGFDPTSDSLHAGNLLMLLNLRRFQEAGHRAIALAGGATGMIGDPSGRSEERNLLDDDQLARNLEGIVPQLRRFLDFDGPNPARLVDNRSWTVATSVIDFLRDVGKHVTVNQMLGKESVRSRLEGTTGISYTEFSYMLLQANDFYELHRLEGCELQIGGSDQWGNIATGIDLIRKRSGAHAHGLTSPLLVRSDGTKYGKSSSGENLWLSAARMSPYRFYQGWIGVPDEDVRKLLLQLTLLPVAEAEGLAGEHEARPERRLGQRRLARELTRLVHGEEQAALAETATALLFESGDPMQADAESWAMLAGEIPSAEIGRQRLVDGAVPVELFAELGLAASKGEARRLLEQGGWQVNGQRLDGDRRLGVGDLMADRYMLVRRGKNRYHLIVAA